MTKKTILSLLLFSLLLSACHAQVSPTLEPTATQEPSPTATLLPSPSASPLPSATTVPSPTPIPSPTPYPFSGFLPQFRLFRTWYDENRTVFYFLNAGLDHPLFARADEFDLQCQPDPKHPKELICNYDGKIANRSIMLFEFFSDPERKNSLFSASFDANLVDDTVYHHQFDCPERGQNVSCNSEYRLYDGVCYYAHTCYDACGLYYSKDNIPTVFNEFQGYTGPCN